MRQQVALIHKIKIEAGKGCQLVPKNDGGLLSRKLIWPCKTHGWYLESLI